MLSLSAPFTDYDGIVVGQDYSNPRQFWYFPNRPHLALDEHGRPVARLIVYRDLADPGTTDDTQTAFFLFDTVVSWPAERLAEVTRRLRKDHGLDEDPLLSPLLYRDGRTRCTFLDRVKPTTPPPGGGDPPDDWVTFIDGPSSPALYGENVATFQVQLTKKGTELLYGSLDGFVPAGVVYELDYPAMQRAFAIRVEADWKVVYDHVREYESTRIIFYNREIEKIVDTLLSEQTVRFHSVIEGVEAEGMPSEYEQARKALQSLVIEKFFSVVPDPKASAEPGIGQQVLDFLGGLRSIGLHLDYSFVKKEVHAEQLRELDADWTVDHAVLRTISPQAHLAVFWEDFTPALTRDDLTTVVTGDQGLFRSLDLDIVAVADFGPDAVALVVVDVAFGDLVGGQPAPGARRFSVTLDADTPRATVREWWSPGLDTQALHYSYRVVFGPDAVVGEGVLLTSAWLPAAPGVITVSPNALYREQRTSFTRARLLDPVVFPQVLAHARYTDPDSGWSYSTSGVLEAGGTPWVPLWRTRSDAPRELEYRLEYPAADGPIVTPWRSTASDLVLVEDPRTNLFTVTVLVGDRSALGQLVVSLRYDDDEVGTHLQTAMVLSKTTVDQPHTWTFPRAAVDRDVYQVSQLLIHDDGTVVQTPWLQSRDAVLVVGPLLNQSWTVQTSLSGPPLAQTGYESVTVALTYDDLPNAVHAATSFTFTQTGRPQPWKLTLADPQARTYRYTVTYRLPNGFARTVGPTSGSDTFLRIPTSPDPS